MAKKRRKLKDMQGQTTLSVSMVDETPNDNMTFPYGLFRGVKHYLDFVGVLKFVRKLKKRPRTLRDWI